MTPTPELLSDLARVKALFQLRAVAAVMGLPTPEAPCPHHSIPYPGPMTDRTTAAEDRLSALSDADLLREW